MTVETYPQIMLTSSLLIKAIYIFLMYIFLDHFILFFDIVEYFTVSVSHETTIARVGGANMARI